MKDANRKRRALVVVGAGASVEFGIPATEAFGKLIELGIAEDTYCASQGGVEAYHEVKSQLVNFYGDATQAHFERIYHVMHELEAFHLTPGAVAKFRPVMLPFLEVTKVHPRVALQAACQAMLSVIYKNTSAWCTSPRAPIAPLKAFFSRLEEKWIPRVYTTNYDDFVGQATDDRYFTGFENARGEPHMLFDPNAFWTRWNNPSLFHMHGSIHMGFPHKGRIGEIAWYPSRDDALVNSNFSGSGLDRMDGTGITRSAIITGLDKLGRLQQAPYSFYYAGLSRDAMEADVIFIFGSGLADLHLNTWIREVRHLKPQLPLLYVGYWPGDKFDMYSALNFDYEDREISLFHDLRIDLSKLNESELKSVNGWSIDKPGAAAVWADGFQSFLSQPTSLDHALHEIGAT